MEGGKGVPASCRKLCVRMQVAARDLQFRLSTMQMGQQIRSSFLRPRPRLFSPQGPFLLRLAAALKIDECPIRRVKGVRDRVRIRNDFAGLPNDS